ncbi:proton-conducting transporter transmembrane domain-containing protein [Caldiplasma sukawensis]
MNYSYILPYFLILLPATSVISYRWKIKEHSLIAGILNIFITFLIFLNLPYKNLFFIDHTTIIFLFMVNSIYVLSLLYSFYYMKDNQDTTIFYTLMGFFVSAMIFSLEINNYGLEWVGIEATTVTSALLIMQEKSENSIEATWRYIIIVSAGVTFAFFSVILINYSMNSLIITQDISRGSSSPIVIVAIGIALLGFGTKVGVFPVHTWLPDAHSEAPSPVSAMFSGVLLPVALYVLYRFYEIHPLVELYSTVAIISLAAATIFLGSQIYYKRMFAYSTMENMSLALLGISIGGYGIIGAFVLILAHSFGKSGAFFSSGSIMRSYGTKKMDEIGGLYRKMPITSIALIMSSFAVTGSPPFGIFVGEILIMSQLNFLKMYVQLAIVGLLLALSFISVNRKVSGMVFEQKDAKISENVNMGIIGVISASISLLIGIIYIIMVI